MNRHVATGDDETFNSIATTAVVFSGASSVPRDDNDTVKPIGGIIDGQVSIANDDCSLSHAPDPEVRFWFTLYCRLVLLPLASTKNIV